MTKTLRATFVAMLGILSWGQLARAQNPTPFKSVDDLVKWVKSHNKAPFDRDSSRLPTGGKRQLLTSAPRAPNAGHNVKVNQDRDPWPKAEIGTAVDPTNGRNVVVMSNDFRESLDHMFYHVSTSGGGGWTDDSMVGGADPVTGFIPLTFQSDPGVAFDTRGHSMLSTITGNLIFDFNNGYENLDTEIEVAEGFAHGPLHPTVPRFQSTTSRVVEPSPGRSTVLPSLISHSSR